MTLMLRGDYFNGDFTSPKGISEKLIESSDENITKFCPADTSMKLWSAHVNYQNIDKVITSAEEGYKVWRKISVNERIEYLKKFQQQVEKRKDEIARAIALETGKPLWESLTEASAISAKVNVTITDSFDRIKNKVIENVLPNITGHFVYKPLGVTLVIGPFNFPCHLANGQILAALLTGNSIIFKPSEKTIASSQMLIECFHAAGFPKGVINFINGTAKTTQDILRHKSVKAIFFTGSYAIGKKILESVGTDVSKLVALELGGKNTTIICSDVDIKHAIPELLRASYLSTGQRCTSTSVVVVHRSVEQEFIAKFKEAAMRIIIDHPIEFDSLPFMGPLIDEQALAKYNDSLALGEKNGAEILLPNKPLDLKFKGHYISPSMHYLKKAEKENPFTQEEIFGPNCTFIPFDTLDEAIEIANISDYGLAASVFTQNLNTYQECLMDIEAGIINLNRSTVGASSRLPFGGVKNSGNFHPAAVSMIDHTAHLISSLETLDNSSKIEDVQGLR